MKRRSVLSTTCSGVIFTTTGCMSSLNNGLTSECPTPDIENEVSYENQLVEKAKHYERAEDLVLLLTDSEQVDDDIERTLDQDGYQFVSETDFNTESAIIIQVVTSSESSDLQILGVEREDSTTLRVYTCIGDEGQTDDLHPHTQVIRVDTEEKVPDEVIVTHFMEDSEHEIKS